MFEIELTCSHKRTSMGPSRSCWNGTTSALQAEEKTSKGTRAPCVYYQKKCPYEKNLETYLMILVYIYIYIYIYISLKENILLTSQQMTHAFFSYTLLLDRRIISKWGAYRYCKLAGRSEFKSQKSIFPFYMVVIRCGNVWIQLFSLQLYLIVGQTRLFNLDRVTSLRVGKPWPQTCSIQQKNWP